MMCSLANGQRMRELAACSHLVAWGVFVHARCCVIFSFIATCYSSSSWPACLLSPPGYG